MLLYSTLHPTLLYRDCAIPTGCVKGDNDLKVVPHFGKYVNLLSFLALNEKVDTTNVCAVSHVRFFFSIAQNHKSHLPQKTLINTGLELISLA